ncbi:MAG: YciI family protein [Actinomycetota bacterium]|nr:YciI family protein [Actinomycetota bacterium]
MRFIMMIQCEESMPAGPPPPSLFAAIDALSEEAVRDGTMLEFVGLKQSGAGALVRASDSKVTVTDGPFAEAKELIGGYAIFQLRSKEEAIESARKFMELHLEHWPGFSGTCEVREIEVRQVTEQPEDALQA